MKHWQLNRTVFKVSDFLSWHKMGSLQLNPNFQRRSVWKKGAKSFLIDTIIRGYPIPIIFIREKQTDVFKLEPIRDVVDGQQRLRTLISYIMPKSLKDYNVDKDEFTISKSHNKELANKKFDDLERDIKQQILDYQFSVNVIPADVEDRDIYQIFARMNSTGLKLNNQELRNSEYFGEFKTSVYESALKYLTQWTEWKIFTEDNVSRMDEVELTTEFYSLMLKGLTSKTPRALDDLYEKYDETFEEREMIEYRFEIVMDMIGDHFGSNIPNSPYKKKTIFYILFVVVYDLTYGLNSKLNVKKHIKLTTQQVNTLIHIGEDLQEGKVPENISESSTRRTTNILERKTLYKYFKGRITKK
jgi:uncharacterized protein with ParB-like and HNH nuclease domain